MPENKPGEIVSQLQDLARECRELGLVVNAEILDAHRAYAGSAHISANERAELDGVMSAAREMIQAQRLFIRLGGTQ